MEVKKSKKAALQGRKPLFLEIGFIAALLVVLLAFEWPTKETSEPVFGINTRQPGIEIDVIAIPNEPPAAAPKPVVVIADDFLVVDDGVKIDYIIDLGIDPDKPIEIKVYPPEQKPDEDEIEPIPFPLVKEKPKFMGGDENEFSKWICSKIVYPQSAIDNQVSGTVLLEFTVSAAGVVTNVSVLRSLDTALDKEAIRVVSLSPKWTPGKQHGKPVPVTFRFPVIFRLM